MRLKLLFIFHWIFAHIELKNIFIPLSTKKFIPVHGEKGWKGVMDVYIFGIRIARFDLAAPWERHGQIK